MTKKGEKIKKIKNKLNKPIYVVMYYIFNVKLKLPLTI